MNDLYIALAIVVFMVLVASALVIWLNRPEREEGRHF